MKMTYAIVALGAALAIALACGPLVEMQDTYIAPELLQGTVVALVDEFHAHCPTENKVQFVALVGTLPGDASDLAVARCTKSTDTGMGMVFILLDRFLSMTENQRRYVVAEELLHCEFGVKHVGELGFMDGKFPTKSQADEFKWEDAGRFCRE